MANATTKSHPWFEICHSRPSAKYQVFIFPAAGTAGSYYREWDRHFPDCEFAVVIYPGRATRFGETLLNTMADYVYELSEGLIPFIDRPCIFIGHSVGTAINYALAKYMIQKKKKGHLLRFLIEMGRGPPNLQDPDRSFADMTDQEIVDDLKRMADPSTSHVYDYPSYMEMLIPILKADARVGSDLVKPLRLDIPIIVYGGEKEENVKEPFLQLWKELTSAEDLFRIRMFPGHHNFQSECETQVLQCLKEDFANLLSNRLAN